MSGVLTKDYKAATRRFVEDSVCLGLTSISLESLQESISEIKQSSPEADNFAIVADECYLTLVFDREETDAEYARRLKEEARAARVKMDRKAQREAKERALFEELRKKFDPYEDHEELELFRNASSNAVKLHDIEVYVRNLRKYSEQETVRVDQLWEDITAILNQE
jgi:hypothetical protein